MVETSGKIIPIAIAAIISGLASSSQSGLLGGGSNAWSFQPALSLLDAQRESFAAEQGATQVRRLRLSASTQLYKALGGEGNASAVKTAQETSAR